MQEFWAQLQKDRNIIEKIKRLGIRKEDITERFIKSQGAGGQNVNKTSTCVYLKHLPTGIEVKFSRQRYQVLNRYLAWKLLVDKIEQNVLKKIALEKNALERLKRQKRNRPRKLKLRILEAKRMHAQKKLQRRKISGLEY